MMLADFAKKGKKDEAISILQNNTISTDFLKLAAQNAFMNAHVDIFFEISSKLDSLDIFQMLKNPKIEREFKKKYHASTNQDDYKGMIAALMYQMIIIPWCLRLLTEDVMLEENNENIDDQIHELESLLSTQLSFGQKRKVLEDDIDLNLEETALNDDASECGDDSTKKRKFSQ